MTLRRGAVWPAAVRQRHARARHPCHCTECVGIEWSLCSGKRCARSAPCLPPRATHSDTLNVPALRRWQHRPSSSFSPTAAHLPHCPSTGSFIFLTLILEDLTFTFKLTRSVWASTNLTPLSRGTEAVTRCGDSQAEPQVTQPWQTINMIHQQYNQNKNGAGKTYHRLLALENVLSTL